MSFDDVDVWIFDLDNTLYPPEAALFTQIEARMTDYVMRLLGIARENADLMRRDWWRLHGTTLAGLMAEHDIDPKGYLDEVHDIDFASLRPDPALADAIIALPGRKIVHTNADATYAGRVLAARGLELFEAVYGIEETGFHPKPLAAAFQTVLSLAGIDPKRAAFFEDDQRNLMIPHDLGMRTVLVGPGRHGPDSGMGADPGSYIHYRTDDLAAFLRRIAPRAASGQNGG